MPWYLFGVLWSGFTYQNNQQIGKGAPTTTCFPVGVSVNRKRAVVYYVLYLRLCQTPICCWHAQVIVPIRQYKDMFTHALQRGVQMQKSKYDDGDWNMRRRFAEQTKWFWEESKQKEDTDSLRTDEVSRNVRPEDDSSKWPALRPDIEWRALSWLCINWSCQIKEELQNLNPPQSTEIQTGSPTTLPFLPESQLITAFHNIGSPGFRPKLWQDWWFEIEVYYNLVHLTSYDHGKSTNLDWRNRA